MPNQAFLGITGYHTIHNQVCALKLLITADDLVFPIFFVGGKHGEELEDVHNPFRSDHILHADLNISQAAFGFMCGSMPWAPHIYRHIDRAVTVALTFGGKVKYISYEHPRNAFFVSGDIIGTVQPGDGVTNRSLQFADGYRETVDQQNNVQPLAVFLLGVYPLIGDHIFVQS